MLDKKNGSKALPSISTCHVALEQVKKFILFAEQLGCTRATLLENVGADIDDLQSKRGYISAWVMEGIYRSAFYSPELAGHESLGIEIAKAQQTNLGIWSIIAEKAPTLGDALVVGREYQDLHSNTEIVSLDFEDDCFHISLEPLWEDEHVREVTAEWFFASLYTFIKSVTVEPTSLLRAISLKKRKPTSLDATLAYSKFFPCEVAFSQDRNTLVLSEGALGTPLITADKGLFERLRQLGDERLQVLDDTDARFVAAVKRELSLLLLSKQYSRSRLASSLGLSDRALQVKLREHKTSYRALLEEVRVGEAKFALEKKRLPINVIARHLAFSDPSAFSHWFKKVTGVSPDKYRKSIRPTSE